jgi:putative ABC transport system permease protein
MKTLRNIFRRKVRAGLTIFGIAIGIFALVVMGSLAEKLNKLVTGGLEYYGTRITVQDASSGMSFYGGMPIAVSKIAEIKKIPGVKSVYASVEILKDEVSSGVNFGVPPMIAGYDPVSMKDDPSGSLKIATGKNIQEGDSRKAVLGADMPKKLNTKIGDTIDLHGEKFKVIGVLDKTFSAPDSYIMVNLPDAQELFLKSLPSAFQSSVKKENLATALSVLVKNGYSPSEVTKQINEKVKDVKALDPDEFKKQIANSIAIFNLIIYAVGLIALIVGSFSVINTMIMSVTERIREIGIKKAIGASNLRILREFVLEAAMMGLIGGLVGLALGWGTVRIINFITAPSGQIIFLTTPRLAIGAVLFSSFLGAFAGLYPAWFASRLSPIKALRSE